MPYYNYSGDPEDPNAFYETHQLWLIGLNQLRDPETNPNYPSNQGWVLEDKPTPADMRLIDEGAEKIITVDSSRWLDRNGGEAKANHGLTGTGISFKAFLEGLQGGNRVHADGHGVWVTPDVMGKDETPIVNQLQARYTHVPSVGQRPYFW